MKFAKLQTWLQATKNMFTEHFSDRFLCFTFRALKASSRWQVACYMTKVC
jgi:uncharacterized protein YciW